MYITVQLRSCHLDQILAVDVLSLRSTLLVEAEARMILVNYLIKHFDISMRMSLPVSSH